MEIRTAQPVTAKSSRKLASLLITVLLPFALAHFISYLYRTVNAVVYPELARELGLAANNIGLLTSTYFLTFAAAQLPVGVALDRYGPRKVQVPMLLIAAVGSVLFANAHSLAALAVARGLIGFGVAGSLMAAIKAGSLWFPPERLPMTTAVLLSVGGLGAMVSTVPMHTAVEYVGWRYSFTGLGIATLIVSCMIFFMVPEHPKKQDTKLVDMIRAVRQLYTSWSFWRIALYSMFPHATYMAVQGLWMGPWLRDIGHMDAAAASRVLLVCSMAMVVGSLTFGWITDYLRKLGYKPILVCGLGIASFMLFQLLMVFGTPVPAAVVAVGFSFFGTATTMNYAIVAQSVPPHLTGRVSTSFNLLVFLLAFGLQWGLGSIINLWAPVSGAYPQTAYNVALSINLALQIPGLLLWFGFKPWIKKVL